jgi:hypothetical protein
LAKEKLKDADLYIVEAAQYYVPASNEKERI